MAKLSFCNILDITLQKHRYYRVKAKLLHCKSYVITLQKLCFCNALTINYLKSRFYITPANGKIGHFTHLPHSFLDEKWLYGG